MTARKLFWYCLTAGSAAFLIGVASGSWSSNASIGCRFNSQADEKPKPPAGDQFEEGPVLVRLPGASTTTTRFIF